LTLCQVRTAANAYLSTQDLPSALRRQRLEQVADTLTLQQQRNAKARCSHRKKTREKFKQLGIDFRKLRRCKLE
jgi:hypothetical protein